MTKGPIERASTWEVISHAIKKKLGGSSGQAARAGRQISGRQRQIDRQVDEAVRGRRKRD